MGIKAIKRLYGLEDMLVHKAPHGICFGTEMAPDVLTVSEEGKIIQGAQHNLKRYYGELEGAIAKDPGAFEEAFREKEEFNETFPVFTYEDGNIKEKACEILGWPNLTTDGELMYENTHFAKRDECIKQAAANLRAQVERGIERVRELSDTLAIEEERLQQAWKELSSLEDE